MSSDNLPPDEDPAGHYSPVPDDDLNLELPDDDIIPLDLISREDVEETPLESPPPTPRSPRWLWPLGLVLATIASTYYVGCYEHGVWGGAVYCLSVMTILVCHEAGHFIQARRYGVQASLPYFLPMPLPPIGTMGAVIRMSSNIPSRKALFDIGISGPLAGLVPTLIFTVVGIMLSKPIGLANPADLHGPIMIEPWLMRVIHDWWFPNSPGLAEHPFAHAGWVGLLITSLNLFPIGQLDGGHVLYAILRRGAHGVAILLLAAAVVAVIYKFHSWGLMLLLLVLMGTRHPPTANDQAPLGVWRIVLGLLTLAFLPFGFTPTPIAG